MKFTKRALFAAFAAAAMAGGASAQTIGGLGGTTISSSGGSSTGGGAGGFGGGTGGTGGAGMGSTGGGGGGSSGTSTNSTGTNSGVATITISAPSQIAQAPQTVATSNILGKYYANPPYQGRAGVTTTSATSVVNPGGFGSPLYGNNFGQASTTGTGTSAGRSGSSGGGFGTTSPNTRPGSAGGATGTSQGIVVQGTPSISYTAVVKFSYPSVSPDQFRSGLQDLINRSSAISNPAGVQLITAPNGVVTIRGNAKDSDEARFITGLLASTPGVRTVNNEMQFPKE